MATHPASPVPKDSDSQLLDVAYYYPEPYWRADEGDWLKNLLLFFDTVAILLPRYMRGRNVDADPALAGPMEQQGLLRVLEPEEYVDQEVTENLTEILVELITGGAFGGLDHEVPYQELSRSRMGWDADVELAGMVTDELLRLGLALPSRDGVSNPLHPLVRSTILILLSQLVRSAGKRHGLDLHPVTASHSIMNDFMKTLALNSMPSAAHIVALDLEIVSLDLTLIPLNEILDFRKEHGDSYRAYARDLRRFIATLSPLPGDERAALIADRQMELSERARELRRMAWGAWARPFASVAMGAAGAVLAGTHGDIPGAVVALGAGIAGATLSKPKGGAYSYIFEAQRYLSDRYG